MGLNKEKHIQVNDEEIYSRNKMKEYCGSKTTSQGSKDIKSNQKGTLNH